MNEQQKSLARACLEGAESNGMTFPQIVGALMQAGFESYSVDFRQASATYYLPDGEFVEVPMHRVTNSVAARLDAEALQSAIREAQQLLPGYTYRGFCENAVAAGCAAYVVSFSGRRALYIGRTAETHVEHFPN